MNNQAFRLWRYGLGGLLASFVALAACGDDDDDGGTPTAGSSGRAGSSGAGGSGGSAGQGPGGGSGGAGGSGGSAGGVTGAPNLVGHVKQLVELYGAKQLPAGVEFPLKAEVTDAVHTLDGVVQSVVVSWLDPLTQNEDFKAGAPFFGGNNDYIAYFGEGWGANPGDPPQWRGSGDAAWLWVNHEYISGTDGNLPPSAQPGAPAGQHATLANFLRDQGVLTNGASSTQWVAGAGGGANATQLDLYVQGWKRQVGGSWVRVVRAADGTWSVDRAATNLRYDATSATQSLVTGHRLAERDVNDAGETLGENVVSGILANCSGGQTPWGTVITAEENFQFAYGDGEVGWSESATFVPANASVIGPNKDIEFAYVNDPKSDFGRSALGQHRAENYGFLVEIDPGVAPDEYEGKAAPGVGHKKIGYLGRARWENASVAVGADWKLLPNQPVVIYGGDDRRGGRIFKFVSSGTYTPDMTRAQVRALLDDGTLYVAQFDGLDNATGKTLVNGQVPSDETPGQGRWIHLSVNNTTDVAPNAAALGTPAKTVGEALLDQQWNSLGAFRDDDVVRRGLYTAANKVGIMELNRPEDIEWNPKDPSGTPRLYVAFTNFAGRIAQLDQGGKLRTKVFGPPPQPGAPPPVVSDDCKVVDGTNPCLRNDAVGSIFSLQEGDPAAPGASKTFTYRKVWEGTEGQGEFDAANPDNLLIDADGGVWFGTDGNFGQNDQPDAVYYLDLNAAHKTAATPTYGKPFRVVTVPSDAEATGPALSADMKTLFVAVQHPGEDLVNGVYSTWPQGPSQPPRSSVVALFFGGN